VVEISAECKHGGKNMRESKSVSWSILWEQKSVCSAINQEQKQATDKEKHGIS
jgi:hypothetical protein